MTSIQWYGSGAHRVFRFGGCLSAMTMMEMMMTTSPTEGIVLTEEGKCKVLGFFPTEADPTLMLDASGNTVPSPPDRKSVV